MGGGGAEFAQFVVLALVPGALVEWRPVTLSPEQLIKSIAP